MNLLSVLTSSEDFSTTCFELKVGFTQCSAINVQRHPQKPRFSDETSNFCAVDMHSLGEFRYKAKTVESHC